MRVVFFILTASAWINLCDSLGLNFTAEAIVNPQPTMVITESGDTVNFEVGEITGENIVDFSINGVDFQNNSITADKLAPDSVGSEELQENIVGDAEIQYNQVTLNDFTNDAGFITGANVVSNAANNAITDNGGAFFDAGPLQAGIDANTAAIAADGDTNATNEIQNLSISGAQLTLSGANTVTLPTADGSDTNINAGSEIAVSGNGTTGTPYVITNTFAETDGSITNELQDLQFDTATNILTISNPGTPGNQVDLNGLTGTGTDDQTLSLDGNEITIENGNTIDLTPILGGTGGSTELADQVTITGTGASGDEFQVADGGING